MFVSEGGVSSVVQTAGTGLILIGIYLSPFSKDKGFGRKKGKLKVRF